MADRVSILTLSDNANNEPNSGIDATDNGPVGTESSGNAGAEFIDPAAITNSGNTGLNFDGSSAGSFEAPRKRGRKKGSTNSRKGETLSVDGVASILVNIHGMLAIVARSPELILDEKEAAEVAKASAMVSRHYDVKMAAKTVDWCNFGVVIATVYGTRILAIRNRVLDERKNKKQTIVPQQELKENTHAGFNSSDPLGGL